MCRGQCLCQSCKQERVVTATRETWNEEFICKINNLKISRL